MPQAKTLVRVLDELLWVLRREGFEVSVAQAIDVAAAVRAVDLSHRADVREAVACIVVRTARDRARFDAVFDAFFAEANDGDAGSLWQRLGARGFHPTELDVLRAIFTDHGVTLGALGVFLESGADLDRLLALSGVARAIDAHSQSQLGFRTYRLLQDLGAGGAPQSLSILRAALVSALGARGGALAAALAQELERVHDRVRAFVRAVHDARVAERDAQRARGTFETTPFASLTDEGIERVRRKVRQFAERLRASARVRTRHARQGAIDPRRMMGQAIRTGGVPFRLPRRKSRRQKPKLIVLCDVSDSVRAAASFLLEFTYAAQELFERARSFVFVSEVGETTALFARENPRVAVARAWHGGGVVRASENSNYGRALRSFEANHLGEVDRRTTVVILGDGRTNYQDAAPEVIDRLRARARAVLWLCPEPRGQWTEGDSAMRRYAPKCTAVYEVRCAADLERAAVALIARL